ncbi:MAG: hypothetical protein WCW68_09195, partial [Methanothrix sp.]
MPIRVSSQKRNHIAAILIIIFLVVISSGECKQYEAGKSYTFIGPTPPVGEIYSYLWTATDGFPTTSRDVSFQWTAPLVTEPTKVIISLLISSGAVGCTSQNETEILVLPSPELSCAFIADTPVCAKSTGNNASVTNPTPGATYVWSIRESPGASITADPADSTKALWSAGTGTWATIVVNATRDGYSSNCSKTVTIQKCTELGVTVANMVICPGDTATLTAIVSGCTVTSYQWYTGDSPSGEMIPDTDSPTYQTTNEGSYTCEVTCDDGRKSYGFGSVSVKECEPAVGSISGTKFEDKNGNSEWDTNEPGLGGWIINLNSQDGEVVKTATTSADQATLGSYRIDSILPGTYILVEVSSFSSDWTQTYPVGNIYTVEVSDTGVVTVTKSDQTAVPSTNADFGNNFTQSGELEITKTTPDVTLIPNMETAFTITVTNIGKTEIHDISIVDELSPILEFIPYAYSGNTLIQHTIEGSNLNFDLSPLGSLQPGDSWTITYNVKLSPDACSAASSSTTLPPVINAVETKLNVMAAGSDPVNIQQIIEALSRNKTKLEAKLQSIKKELGTFDKANATMESGTKSIAGTNYTRSNYTNISTGDTLNELLNATGFLVSSEYTRPAKYDLLTTTYGRNGEVLSDFYTFSPTKETLKIEYNKPEKGYKTYTVRYYATGDTLIISVDFYGNVVSREYRKTPGMAAPKYLTNCATAYGNVGEQQEPVESNRACVDVGWKCESAVGSISGTKFEDKNGNNEWDTNEPGIGEWMINLKRQDGEIVGTAITSTSPAALGSYIINSISPGTYTLEEMPSLSSDWTQTYPLGNIYLVVVSETGQVAVTKSDQTDVQSTQVNFGNKFTQSGELEITKTTPTEILNPNTQATFIIAVKNTGIIEIHD